MIDKPMGTKDKTPLNEGVQPREDVLGAYQIHTLAQMLYGHLAARHAWAAPPLMMGGYDPTPGFPMPPAPPMAPHWMGLWGMPMGPMTYGPPPPWSSPYGYL